MKINQTQSEILSSLIDYFNELEEVDITAAYMLERNFDKANQIRETYFDDLERKVQQKKMVQIQTALDKIITAIKDVE